MAKAISLNRQEKSFLIPNVHKRLRYYEESNASSYMAKLENILCQLPFDYLSFTPSQKALLCGITRENSPIKFESKRNEFLYKYPMQDLLYPSVEVTEAIQEIDFYQGLFNKFAVKTDRKKLLSEKLAIYQLLRELKTSWVYYSGSNDDIYKIGFPIGRTKRVRLDIKNQSRLDDNDLNKLWEGEFMFKGSYAELLPKLAKTRVHSDTAGLYNLSLAVVQDMVLKSSLVETT